MSAEPERLKALTQALHERRIRITDSRMAILRALASSDDHPDALQLLDRARAYHDTLSAASVYRTIRLLEDEGVIVRHDWGGRGRYEEASRESHLHIIDLQEGRVVEVPAAELEPVVRQLARELGYRLVDYRLELFGEPSAEPQDAE